MQGKLIIGLAALVAIAGPATATEPPRRPACPKLEPQRQQAQQHPVRPQSCRATKTVPPVVDPTPMFLL